MKRIETVRRLSLYYSARFSGKVTSEYDESKRKYEIHGSCLPSHSSCPNPTWTMSDHVSPAKARELVANKTDDELREAARIKAAEIKAGADAIVEGPDHPWRIQRERIEKARINA